MLPRPEADLVQGGPGFEVGLGAARGLAVEVLIVFLNCFLSITDLRHFELSSTRKATRFVFIYK